LTGRWKKGSRRTTLRLVFGNEAIMPMEYWVPSLILAVKERWETNNSMERK
jgi:hypothetical protein